MRKRLEQLEIELLDSREENEQLNQRLSGTLSRINILKSSNQVRWLVVYRLVSFDRSSHLC